MWRSLLSVSTRLFGQPPGIGHTRREIHRSITQALDTDNRNPASRFLLHVLGAAAEFERNLIRERSSAGWARYLQDYRAGRVGKTVRSRSGKNLPTGQSGSL